MWHKSNKDKNGRGKIQKFNMEKKEIRKQKENIKPMYLDSSAQESDVFIF